MKPWLWLSPTLAHQVSPILLSGLARVLPESVERWQPFTWRGLEFPNRLGIAGGVDKDARNIEAWTRLGSGFVEIGTVTPQAQSGNPPPILARDTSHEAVWNRLGFPSQGLARVRRRLQDLPRPHRIPVFANVGKNAVTTLENAGRDYRETMRGLAGLVDGFVINISSPNTAGLRELLKPERLQGFLSELTADLPKPAAPVLLKISPDLSEAELNNALQVSLDLPIDGWILTNTSQRLREGLRFPAEGGVSGRPLATTSKQFLRKSLELLGRARAGKLVISVGGVMSCEDVQERLALGADLVQVYSALIFMGPWFFREVARWQRVNQH